MFQPPEAWNKSKTKGKPIDVWGIGVTFYYLAFRSYPFFTTKPAEFQTIVETTEPSYPKDADPGFIDLLKLCLKKDHSERITIPDIINHPWITKDCEFPLQLSSLRSKQIKVTLTDIKNAFTPKVIEANVFALSKMKARLSRQRAGVSISRLSSMKSDADNLSPILKKERKYKKTPYIN